MLVGPAGSFIGRASELELIGELLSETRLLTIMGTGGSGKTRLAYEAAGKQGPKYPGGVFICNLAPLADVDRLAAAVASAFDTGDDPGLRLGDVVAQQIGDRPALLVLDNCEHLRSGVSALLGQLLARAPNLSILATSRERLRVPGETAWMVPPLSLPDENGRLEGSDAAALLIDRVRRINPGYVPNAEARVAMAQICIRLEGIPLAIELAASRMAIVTPAQLLNMLDNAITTLAVDEGPPRQRTLKDALDWSYDLLSEEDRATFRRLSVFAGPFGLAAAAAVLKTTEGDVMDRLGALRDASLLTTDISGDKARFRLLEPVRQYAAELFRSDPDQNIARRLHAGWALGAIEDIGAEVFSRAQQAAVRNFKELLPDLRVAFAWSLVEEQAWAARMAAATKFLWDMTGQLTEGDLFLRTGLGADPTVADRARIYIGLSNLADRRGDEKLQHYAELAVANARAASIDEERGQALFMLGHALRERDPDASDAAFDEASEIAIRTRNRLLAAWVIAIRTLGKVASGGVVEARRAHESQIPIVIEIGDIHSATIALANLARICAIQGDNAAARRNLRTHLRLLAQQQNWAVAAPVLIIASTLAARAGRLRESAQLAGAYWRLCQLTDRMPFTFERELTMVRGHLTPDEYDAAVSSGAALQIADMFALARHEAERSESSDFGNLTQRELEVAKLVAHGLSNKEVAARIRRKERTVESHVQHALQKLHMSSRTELAVWAQRRGLLDADP